MDNKKLKSLASGLVVLGSGLFAAGLALKVELKTKEEK